MSGLAISLAAFLAAAQPADPAAQPPLDQPAAAPAAKEDCRTARPTPDKDEIVVCAERQEGYRINSDVMQASRAAKQRGQRPKIIDNGTRSPTLCEHIGGCSAVESLNIVNTALIAAQLLARAAKGESLGDMLKTQPEPSEYDLYLEAKRNREAREAEIEAQERAAAEAAAKKASKVDGD